jgi:hypothetical protein
MRNSLIVGALFIAGCAGQQSSPPPAPTTAYVSASGQPLAAVPTNADGTIDAKKLADAKKAGYSVVNTNGEKLYCKTEVPVGTHIHKNTDTTCLTQAQMDAREAAMRNALQGLPSAQSNTQLGGHN